MIQHVFKLIWNRKRANALIMVELLVTFLILFALIAFSLNLYRLYSRPLGFDVADTWSVTIVREDTWSDADRETYRQLLTIAEQMDEVEDVELMFDKPFDLGGSSMNITLGNMNRARVDMNVISPGLPEALGLQLLEGRWFGPEDDVVAGDEEPIMPIIVNRIFRDTAGGDVVGKLVPMGPGRQQRIVGVYDEFRHHGQFSAPAPMMMQRLRVDGTSVQAARIMLFLKPGLAPEFEEQLLGVFQRAAPGWDFDVETWEELQQFHFRLYTVPLMIGGGLVLFLLLMVGFGLLGVLWQNVIRRTPEMGLRRAMGAPAGAVRVQVVLELVTVALLSLVLGVAIAIQFPLSGVLRALDWNLFLPSAVLSSMVLLGMCILFALYPSYQATRQDPVEALRYE